MVDAKSRKWAELQVLETLTEGIDIAMQNQALAVPVLAHRIVLGFNSGGTENTRKWMAQILSDIPVPTEEFSA